MSGHGEMVKRVATVLAGCSGDNYEGHARCVIAAMRDPTQEMTSHALPHMDSWSSNLAWWAAMIDGALKR